MPTDIAWSLSPDHLFCFIHDLQFMLTVSNQKTTTIYVILYAAGGNIISITMGNENCSQNRDSSSILSITTKIVLQQLINL